MVTYMDKKKSTKDVNDQRIVFEVNKQTKDDLNDLAKSQGLTVANVLRKLTADYIKKAKK